MSKWRFLALVSALLPVMVFLLVVLTEAGRSMDSENRKFLFFLIFSPVFLGGLAAHKLGRNPLTWGLGGFLYGIPTIFLAVLGPKEKENKSKSSCPFCGSHDIEKPTFGGKSLEGAPAQRTIQLRQYQKCRGCGEFFEPPLPTALAALLLFPIPLLGTLGVALGLLQGKPFMQIGGVFILIAGIATIKHYLFRGETASRGGD